MLPVQDTFASSGFSFTRYLAGHIVRADTSDEGIASQRAPDHAVRQRDGPAGRGEGERSPSGHGGKFDLGDEGVLPGLHPIER